MKNSMKWTKDQQKVIDLRKRNILVSAAAGSGKTAVLVERIISMITDSENPVDIDRLLIVTFTKAAAREMRERIGHAIDKKLQDNPNDVNLQKQAVLVRNAHITTIDSFCLNIVKNYFNEIDLNPGFRIADENELSLIKADILNEVLEEYYEEASDEFLQMIEDYGSTRSDKNIEELVLNLFNCSTSYPWPLEWLRDLKKNFDIKDESQIENSLWMYTLKEYIYNMVYDIKKTTEVAIEICNSIDGPEQYIDNLFDDNDIYNTILASDTYKDLYNAFSDIKYSTLSRKRLECDADKKERVKSIRDNCKKTIQDIKKKYFFQSPKDMFRDIVSSRNSVVTLVDITIKFYERYAKEKEERNVLDFSDIEHFALNILIDRKKDDENEEIVPTDVAVTLSNYYEEILIDEYQDSNYVQETLLNIISKEKFGNPNVFMVGDVKQSIYKFRMAKPELFIAKYDAYSTKDSDYQKVDLCQNFRSRECVLDGVNTIFEKIMTKKLGNIEYDDKARLYTGASYLEDDNTSRECELIMVETNTDNIIDDYYQDLEEGLVGEAELLDLSKKEKEAKVIAKRIKELVDKDSGLSVQDKDEEGNLVLRNAEYKDIVILLRGLSSWAEVIVDVFAKEGIPVNVETRTGYFSATEIRLALNMLKIINNPRQDIPLVAVLRSVVGGMSNEEIAIVRAKTSAIEYYDAMDEYRQKHNNTISKKIDAFLDKLEYFRSLVPFTPIHELIQKVLADTGYYNYIYANVDGDRRRMNLDMLVEKAIAYEKTSYKGLFNFIKFIEKMVKYDIDFGEADATSGSNNHVRVMTIHKSKGLEFPIVFVAGMGNQFNMMDTRGKLLIHPELGIAPDFIDSKLRLKCPTLVKNVVANTIREETIAEELRILYVALTRAKEKLILTGTMSKIEDKLKKYSMVFDDSEDTFSYKRIENAGSYFDLVIPALMDNEGFRDILERNNILQKNINLEARKWIISTKDYMDLITEDLIDDVINITEREELLQRRENEIYCRELLERLKQEINYKYPYENQLDMKGKFSVSELKRNEQLESIEPIDAEELFKLEEENKKVPKFIKDTVEIKANERGNAYHKVMELLDIDNISSLDDVKKQIKNIHERGYISEEQYDAVNPKEIYSFTVSELGQRVVKAKKQNRVFSEKQFVMGMKACDIFDDSSKGEENILVQGIIDMFFEEDGELVLVDYKTDRVNARDGEKILRERYSKQLEFYKKALEQLTNQTVKESMIYSFALGRVISC